MSAGVSAIARGQSVIGPWGASRGPWSSLIALAQAEQGSDVSTVEITGPEQARSVFDFEAAAKKKIPIAHFQYLEQGAMVATDRAGFTKFRIRDRRVVDVSNVDMSVNLFGTKWETPIFLCPCGSQNAYNPEGEIAVARAAGAKGHLQILSSATTSSIEDVIAAHGGSGVWFQLYATNVFDVTRALIKRAQAAGAPAVAFTVDNVSGESSNDRGTVFAYDNSGGDTRVCGNCHAMTKQATGGNMYGAWARRKPMYKGIDLSDVNTLTPANVSWDMVKRIRDMTTMKFLLKGIASGEDAQLAVEHGVDAIIVSNHGGRAAPGSRATIEILPEVIDAVDGKIPVLIDSGFRRGEDVFKALALGARAVGIGRGYLWGLGSFGQPGVEAVLTMLRRELRAAMVQAGTPSIHKIIRDSVVHV